VNSILYSDIEMSETMSTYVQSKYLSTCFYKLQNCLRNCCYNSMWYNLSSKSKLYHLIYVPLDVVCSSLLRSMLFYCWYFECVLCLFGSTLNTLSRCLKLILFL